LQRKEKLFFHVFFQQQSFLFLFERAIYHIQLRIHFLALLVSAIGTIIGKNGMEQIGNIDFGECNAIKMKMLLK